MALVTDARNATLEDLATLLKDQQAQKVDVVAPATAIRSEDGTLVIEGALTETVPDPAEGFREERAPGRFVPTSICDDGISEKLGIHRAYLRRLRTERPDLYDANVNGWLHGLAREQTDDERASGERGAASAAIRSDGRVNLVDADPRKFLVRCFADPDGGPGIARAFLSDGFGFIDHLDVLGGTLEGIQQAGVGVKITRCDLTERRMYVVVEAPEIAAAAPVWLAGYRSPFDDPEVDAQRRHGGWTLDRVRDAAAREGLGYEPGTEPVVHAGFVISNSETGGGAAQIVPRIVVQACRNGLRIEADMLRRVHLGSRLEAGTIRWSEDTIRKNLDLVVAQARDAVSTFLDVDYLQMKLDGIEAKADAKVSDPAKTIEVVTKQLGFGEARVAGILDHFIRGAQMTAGGVLNAITSYAQCVPDADEAHMMEAQALRVLDLAARVG